MPQFDPRKAETPKTSLPTGNPQAPKFLDQVANACRLKRFSYRTEQAYVSWAKRFILFHNKRHPNEMGEAGWHCLPPQRQRDVPLVGRFGQPVPIGSQGFNACVPSAGSMRTR